MMVGAMDGKWMRGLLVVVAVGEGVMDSFGT